MTRREASHRRAQHNRFRNYGQPIGMADDNAMHRQELQAITTQYIKLLSAERLRTNIRRLQRHEAMDFD